MTFSFIPRNSVLNYFVLSIDCVIILSLLIFTSAQFLVCDLFLSVDLQIYLTSKFAIICRSPDIDL